MKQTVARYCPAITLALALLPSWSLAETLHIFRGDPAQAITLAPGAKIFVDAAAPFFVEFAVASPGVAGVSPSGPGSFALTGNREGRTTLTVFPDEDVDTVKQVDILVTPNADSIVLQDKEESAIVAPILLPPTPAPQVIEVMNGVTVQEIALAAHQAIVLKTDVPFTKIVAADTAVAAGAVLWAGKGAYIIGKSAGSTILTLSRDGSAEPTQLTVLVTLGN